jgi:hypothetical protein
MDWTAIGALGEVSGAVGVIVSLLYLGRQIHGAAVQEQRARLEAAQDRGIAWTNAIHQSGDVAALTLRGLQEGPEALAPNERLRFYAGMYLLFSAYERMVEYATAQALPTWGMNSFSHTFQGVLAFPGAQRYWEDRKDWFSPETRESVTELLQSASKVMVRTYDQSGSAR